MLQNFGTALSREQMKNVLGGQDAQSVVGGDGAAVCHVGLTCSVFHNGQTYHGTCAAGFGGGSGNYMNCGCSTQLGPYEVGSNGGVSRCIG